MKGNPFADHEWPSEMEEWHGASTVWFGASSCEYGSMTKATPPHLIQHATLGRNTWGEHAMYGKPYCGAGMAVGMRCFERKDWELRNSHYMAGAPLRFCHSCWRNFHTQNGLEVPVQEKFDPLFAHYIVWPVREVVNTQTGERIMPDIILQEKRWGGRGSGVGDVVAYMQSDLKVDGTPKYNGRGMHLHTRYTHGGWAIYDEGLEAEASELRAEIAMHRRKLAEAERLMLDLYREAEDPEMQAEWTREKPESVEAPEVFDSDRV